MILVTGGGGFIGRRVCRLFYERGFEVTALDLQFPANAPYRQVTGDFADQDFSAGVMRGGSFDTVVHLASMLKTASRKNPPEALRVNVSGSLGLLELATRSEVRKFIYGSSITAYGPKPFAGYGEVAEEEPAAPNTIYGLTKRFVEMAGQNYNAEGLLQFLALRIGMVVGPGAVNTSTPWRSQIFEQLGAKQATGINFTFGQSARLPLIFLDDVAEAIRQLQGAAKPAYTVYNTPTENWTATGLAGYIKKLNPNLELNFTSTAGLDDPEAINGQRLKAEFDFHPPALQERFRQFAANLQ